MQYGQKEQKVAQNYLFKNSWRQSLNVLDSYRGIDMSHKITTKAYS